MCIEDCDEISDFVEKRLHELKELEFLNLTNGVPSDDTILRVVEAVNPHQLRAGLALCRENILASLCNHHIIIDGKKLRGESEGCQLQWTLYAQHLGLGGGNMYSRERN